MKKLFMISALLLLFGCTDTYDAISYHEDPEGVTTIVDTTKFEPVLMRHEKNGVSILDKHGVKKLEVMDFGSSLGLFVCCIAIAFLVGFISAEKS